MFKLVSIIVPVYQGEKYISKCLETIKNQTYKNLEIIVVDDGSTDRSSEIIEKHAKADKRITLLKQSNNGAASARNMGLKSSSGDYVLFVDADDWIDSALVANLVTIFDIKKIDAIVPLYNYFIYEADMFERVIPLFNPKNLIIDSPQEYVVDVMFKQGCNWSVARGAMYNNNLIKRYAIEFPERHTVEDLIFNMRYFCNANKIAVLEKAHYFYLARKNSISRTFNSKLFNTYLFIDQEARQFVENYYLDKEKGYVACNQLLCRNIILFIIQYMQYLQGRPFNEKYSAVLKVMSDKRVSESFSSTIYICPFWPSVLKKYYVFLLHLLFRKRGLRYLALHLINILIKTGKAGI